MDRPPTTIDRSDRLIASESVNMGSKKKRVTEANKHFVKLWPMSAFVGCQVWVLHEDESLRNFEKIPGESTCSSSLLNDVVRQGQSGD